MTARRVIVWTGALVAVVLGTAGVALIGGYRLNLTPSEPLGLWRIDVLHRPVALGYLVFICPPDSNRFEEALRRGYLRRGLCAGGFAPLIKTVAAVAGQRIDINDSVRIDGKVLVASRVRKTDGEDRKIVPYSGGIVPPSHLFLHSSFASSYDSRYFGPVPDSGLLGLARPVLTFKP